MSLTIIGNLCPRHKNTLELFVLQDMSEIKPEYFKVHGPSERKDCLPKDILAIDDAVQLFLKNDTRFGDDYSIIITDTAASYKILAPRFSFNAIIVNPNYMDNIAPDLLKDKDKKLILSNFVQEVRKPTDRSEPYDGLFVGISSKLRGLKKLYDDNNVQILKIDNEYTSRLKELFDDFVD